MGVNRPPHPLPQILVLRIQPKLPHKLAEPPPVFGSRPLRPEEPLPQLNQRLRPSVERRALLEEKKCRALQSSKLVLGDILERRALAGPENVGVCDNVRRERDGRIGG